MTEVRLMPFSPPRNQMQASAAAATVMSLAGIEKDAGTHQLIDSLRGDGIEMVSVACVDRQGATAYSVDIPAASGFLMLDPALTWPKGAGVMGGYSVRLPEGNLARTPTTFFPTDVAERFIRSAFRAMRHLTETADVFCQEARRDGIEARVAEMRTERDLKRVMDYVDQAVDHSNTDSAAEFVNLVLANFDLVSAEHRESLAWADMTRNRLSMMDERRHAISRFTATFGNLLANVPDQGIVRRLVEHKSERGAEREAVAT